MSNYKYEFGVSIGYPDTDRIEEIDLVDDLGYDESDLDGMSGRDVQDIADNEVADWQARYVEYWAERI